jgi:hypothetical protein
LNKLLEKFDFLEYKNFNNNIGDYVSQINIKKEKFIFKSIINYNKELFENHAKYMFFQDFCYILYEKVIDGESFISNI